MNKIRNKKGEVMTDTTEIQKIIREYQEQLHANKMDNLEGTDIFLERYNFLRQNQEELENINDSIRSNESESMSHSVLSDSLPPHGLQPPSLLCPWNSPVKNTGVGSHSLLQGIFMTQKFNLGLGHCKCILYHLSHQASPNARLDTIKFLEENIGKTHLYINHRKTFIDSHSGVMKIKTKTNKWDQVKLKSFCTAN